MGGEAERWLRTEREERLWQALRRWRKETADAHNVPAYAVFSDHTLRELVEQRPECEDGLRQIYGCRRQQARLVMARMCWRYYLSP